VVEGQRPQEGRQRAFGVAASTLRRNTLECRAVYANPVSREGGPREVAAFGILADQSRRVLLFEERD
jgi:hypothetical protein